MRNLFPLLVLTAVLAACGSPTMPAVSSTAPRDAGALTSTPLASPAATASESPLPVATSRGAGLHATDPSTVSLDSGGLLLVEFFRFT